MSQVTLIPASEQLENGLAPIDTILIVVILGSTFAVGVYASILSNEIKVPGWLLCEKKTRSCDQSTERRSSAKSLLPTEHDKATSFFLADRSMAFYFVGASLFASNVGSEHFVGQAGDGAKRGIAVAMYELYAAILLLLLGWIFAPIYRRAKINTTPEFLERRYNKACRQYLSVITCIMYILTKMSASIYGGAVILSATLGWDLYLSAGVCILLSAIYSISGGLRAIMYTDLLQTAIFVVGGLVVSWYSLREVGGLSGLRERLADQGKEDFWHLFKPPSDVDYPWTGMLLGQPIGSIWYWCMDQDLVQRVLAAKDNVHAKGGCVFAAVLKILPLFVMVLPGVVAGVVYDFSSTKNGTDGAYAALLTKMMPHGIIGLMIASIMTAMMSSLDSVFNAGSAIITYDIYHQIYPQASDKTLLWVGRISTVVYAVLSFAWIPIISNGEGLYRQVVEIQGYLAPPIGIVALLGVVSRRMNGAGAISGLVVGGILGVVRLLVSVILQYEKSELSAFGQFFFFMNFQHFAILLWVITGLVCVLVSFATKAPADVDDYLIKWDQVFIPTDDELRHPSWIRSSVLGLGVGVFGATFAIWIIFG